MRPLDLKEIIHDLSSEQTRDFVKGFLFFLAISIGIILFSIFLEFPPLLLVTSVPAIIWTVIEYIKRRQNLTTNLANNKLKFLKTFIINKKRVYDTDGSPSHYLQFAAKGNGILRKEVSSEEYEAINNDEEFYVAVLGDEILYYSTKTHTLCQDLKKILQKIPHVELDQEISNGNTVSFSMKTQSIC